MSQIIATKLQNAATRIFRDISPILQNFGTVTKGGSFNLNLMAWPDMDLYLDVGTKDPLKSAFQMTEQVIKLPQFFAIKVERDMTKRLSFVPIGTYVQFQKRRPKAPHWKIDLWILSTKRINLLQSQAQEFQKHLNPQKRKLILQMKHSLLTPRGRTPTQSGYWLLHAIAIKEMKNKADILRFLRQKGVKLEDKATPSEI